MATFFCLCKFATFSNISSRTFSSFLPSKTSIYHSLSSSSATFSFTWDDAFRISQPQTATQHRSTYLQAFFHKVQLCNRAPVSSYHCLLCFLGNTNNEDKLVYWEFETPNCAFVHHPLYFPIKLFLFGFWNMGLANVGDHKLAIEWLKYLCRWRHPRKVFKNVVGIQRWEGMG